MELEEAIKILKYQLANRNTDVYTPINYEAIETVINHITKQDKMIEKMVEYLEDELTIDDFCTKENCYADEYINGHCQKCLKCIKQYFEKKAEE